MSVKEVKTNKLSENVSSMMKVRGDYSADYASSAKGQNGVSLLLQVVPTHLLQSPLLTVVLITLLSSSCEWF